jgi:Arc/MetJ-type ribon-helix-helix transcriptional regulator
VKLSVSLSEEDVAVLDAYVENAGLPSRSAGLQKAVQLLRHPELEDDYARAWTEWFDEESLAWEVATGDGVADAAR